MFAVFCFHVYGFSVSVCFAAFLRLLCPLLDFEHVLLQLCLLVLYGVVSASSYASPSLIASSKASAASLAIVYSELALTLSVISSSNEVLFFWTHGECLMTLQELLATA